MNKTPKILIIGTVSQDKLHLPNEPKSIQTIGGAGMYTASAVYKAGGMAVLITPIPSDYAHDKRCSVFAPFYRQVAWFGPHVPLEEMPRLEIAHHGNGKATLLDASWGAEHEVAPEMIISYIMSDFFGPYPIDMDHYDAVHIAALPTARRQYEFLTSLRAQGAKQISVGTYAKLVYNETEDVRRLYDEADLFFMNENEAIGLFGSLEAVTVQQGKICFVTVGEAGAWVIMGEERVLIPAPTAIERDPTGAGDTFCGATLALMAAGKPAVEAATIAVKYASKMIESVGPEWLLS